MGTPLGHTDFVSVHLMKKLEEHDVLLARIPLIQDLQSAWALFLHCSGGRANYLLRVVRPELVHEFAEGHNTGLLNCLCSIMNIVPGQIHEVVKDIITMPLSIGGMGLRSAHRTSPPAYWASWADSLPMIRERHPEVARTIIDRAGRPNPPPSLESAVRVARDLEGVDGFEVPSWEALSLGERPAPREPDEFEPGGERHGWQHEAASRVERQYREGLLPRITESEKAQLRSQSGPLAGMTLSVALSNVFTRIESPLFRVLLQRRLRLALPLSARQCRCGRPLDIVGHHRAGCARAGFLGRRGFAVESAGARICREAGGRVVTNAMFRDFDLADPDPEDRRRIEILADALSLFRGAQLTVDTTLVSALHCDGSAHPRAAHADGAVLVAAKA